MSPDFATEVALHPDFETKVTIRVEPYKECRVEYDEEGKVYSEGEPYTMYVPYITKVENHWYRDLDFTGCYIKDTDNPDTEDNEAKQEVKREEKTVFVPVLDENGEQIIIDGEPATKEEKHTVVTYTIGAIHQTKEPKRIDNSKRIKEILLGGEEGKENTNEQYKFYIYDGNALGKDKNGQDVKEREKRYIVKKIDEDGELINSMDTSMFQQAFAILEDTHTLDSQYVLRDLKELFKDLEVYTEDTEKDEDVQPMEWILNNYTPIVWDPMFNTEETKMTIKVPEGHVDEQKFYDKLTSRICMPADGEIEKITDHYIYVKKNGKLVPELESQTFKIKLANKMTIYISGIVNYTFDEKGRKRILSEEGKKFRAGHGFAVPAGAVIATSRDTADISIVMTDKYNTPIKNVDKYICPPDIYPGLGDD